MKKYWVPFLVLVIFDTLLLTRSYIMMSRPFFVRSFIANIATMGITSAIAYTLGYRKDVWGRVRMWNVIIPKWMGYAISFLIILFSICSSAIMEYHHVIEPIVSVLEELGLVT